MLIEAVDRPITYQFPGGEILLDPGVPVHVPNDRAAKLLMKVGAKVRVVENRKDDLTIAAASSSVKSLAGDPLELKGHDWLTAWRVIADLVYGVTIADPRMPAIIAAMELCDAAFEHDDWGAWQLATEAVRQTVIPPSPEPTDTRRIVTATGACCACRQARFWLSIHHALVCGVCHPPADPALIAEWLTA